MKYTQSGRAQKLRSEISGKKITVIGGGVSGIAVSRLLHRRGAQVFLTEKEDSVEKRRELEALTESGIEWEIGQHSIERIIGSDAMILSPGISPTIPVLYAAVQEDIPVYSEIEAAFWFCASPVLAVTGTNGKTTAITVLGEMLHDYGIRAAVAGNIGTPFSAVVDHVPAADVFVLELSSYQLERISMFHPQTAVILNITPDHMDRYRDIDDYAQTKFRITMNQTGGDYFIYNADDPEVVLLVKSVEAVHIPYSLNEIEGNGVWLREGTVFYRMEGAEEALLSRDDILLPGEHNLSNIMACSAAALLAGVSARSIRDTVRKFKGIEHRIEFVLSAQGRTFYNDSKGTNVEATAAALKSIDPPVILIAGGKDKNTDLTPLNDLIQSRVRVLILIGEAADRMANAWESIASSIVRVSSLESAVRKAWEFSREGDAILLSPACASFDMFSNFEERGEVFKEAVRSIAEGLNVNKYQ